MSYQRKTSDEFRVQGYYGSQYGWEDLTTHDNRKDAKEELKVYNANEPQYKHRVKVCRVKIA
jgi:hypothetical protein